MQQGKKKTNFFFSIFHSWPQREEKKLEKVISMTSNDFHLTKDEWDEIIPFVDS